MGLAGASRQLLLQPLSPPPSSTLLSGWASLKAITSVKGRACWDMTQPQKVLQARLPIDNLAKFIN